MSPLKPPILIRKPRGPQPRDKRELCCPHCGQTMTISRKALSLRCPRCTQPMKLQDITVRRRATGSLNTMGHVHLTAHSRVDGALVCGQLTIAGQYHGQAQVHGSLQLQAKSHTTGEIHARSLVVEPGATLAAKAVIGPQHTPADNSTKNKNKTSSAA